MSDKNFIKNITSKDIELSKNTILNMIKSVSLDDFRELCEKSDFIFPFLKERIVKDFVKLINKEDLKAVFEFSKIYCSDFEDLIVNSLLKFASEDLTDEILNILENGTQEQKAYCVLYFSHIQDTLSLEYLNKYSYSDFEPLKINCAQTLSKFGDKTVYNEMKNIILNSDDDFKKMSAFSYISAYKGNDAIDFIVNNMSNSPLKVQIASCMLDFNDLDSFKNLEQYKIIQIFSTLIEGYPEDISLETIGYYRILDFVKLINSYNTQFAKNSLILAREKFREFCENDIYTYDLDKNTKLYLSDINNYFKSLKLDTKGLSEELKEYNSDRYNLALGVIKELNLKEYSNILVSGLHFLNEENIAKTAVVLKELQSNNLIPVEILNNIQNENIKALVKSLIN